MAIPNVSNAPDTNGSVSNEKQRESESSSLLQGKTFWSSWSNPNNKGAPSAPPPALGTCEKFKEMGETVRWVLRTLVINRAHLALHK